MDNDGLPTYADYYEPGREVGEAELAVLAEPRVAVLATVSPSGDPLMAPCWYLYEDDKFLASVHTDAQRAKNVTATGRARILIEHPLGYVSAVGDARLIIGPDTRRVHDRICARYLSESGKREFLDAGVPDDAAIELTPTTWTISDMTKTSIPTMLRHQSIEKVGGWFATVARRDR